jgi:hypothetical protein
MLPKDIISGNTITEAGTLVRLYKPTGRIEVTCFEDFAGELFDHSIKGYYIQVLHDWLKPILKVHLVPARDNWTNITPEVIESFAHMTFTEGE